MTGSKELRGRRKVAHPCYNTHKQGLEGCMTATRSNAQLDHTAVGTTISHSIEAPMAPTGMNGTALVQAT